ncbi:hypothetical protein [Streptomyces sp. NBC_01423]|uniref:hypothetical protein n=1 Tax=Streptomyces sp. NBC_01423 TaxID=2903860 RepID=UPI002E2C38EC|nr:hypothetical protein [Streptomyces sp. NBC_01423]
MTPDDIARSATPAERRLAGLALNPAAPDDILLRLLAGESAAVRMVLCRDRALPDAVVDAVVAHPDTYTRSFLARSPHAEPEQRARLVDDPEWFVRAHLTDGPVRDEDGCPARPLPDRTVVRIIETYEDELIDTGLLRQMSPGFRRGTATHPVARVRQMWGGVHWDVLAPWARAALLADPDPGVREAAARNHRFSQRRQDPDAVREDLPDRPCRARSSLLMYGALAPDVVAAALETDGAWAVAGNTSTPAEHVAVLAGHSDPKVRIRVARRPDLAPALRRALAVDPDPGVRLALSVHPALTEAERAAIDYEVPEHEDCGHCRLPDADPDPEQLRRDARSGHPCLRRRAARDPGLPADLVAELADDPDLGVRVLLSQNHPDAPAALLLRSFLEYTGPHRWHLTRRPAFPRTGLARFADDEDPAVRRLAPLDPRLGPETADRLTRDADPLVRADAARHPRLPVARITALLDDAELAPQAAANPSLPLATMNALVP